VANSVYMIPAAVATYDDLLYVPPVDFLSLMYLLANQKDNLLLEQLSGFLRRVEIEHVDHSSEQEQYLEVMAM
jgi:hypothetical protein